MHLSFVRLLCLLPLLVPLALAGRTSATPPALAPTPTAPIGVPYGTPTATPPPLPAVHAATAIWDGPRARVRWSSDAPILCVDRAGPPRQFVGCGHADVLDPSPHTGDVYILYAARDIARVPLVARVLLPFVAR